MRKRAVFKFLACSSVFLLTSLLSGACSEAGTNTRSVTVSWLEGRTFQMYMFRIFWLSASPRSSIYFIIESQNRLGWKRLLRSSSPTVSLALQSLPLNHVPKCHICTSLKYLQGWWFSRLPGQHVLYWFCYCLDG